MEPMQSKRAYEKPRIEALGSIEEMTQQSVSKNAFDGYYLSDGQLTPGPPVGGDVALGSI
jgi:hypothetical protein